MASRRKPKPSLPRVMDKEEAQRCLLEAHDILRSLEVPHFLILGTALGAYRDKGFTPLADDIDIGFLQEEFEPAAPNIARSLIRLGYEVHTVNRPFLACRAIKATRRGVKLDMVAYWPWKGKRFCTSGDPRAKPYSIVHTRDMLETYDTVELFGQVFQVPYPIEEYLHLEYGSAWRIPLPTHLSLTRVYGFCEKEGITNDYRAVKNQPAGGATG